MRAAILVRHGESEANVLNVVSHDLEGFALTLNGKEHARIAGEQLSKINIDEIKSSPVQRARETAAIISSRTGKQISLDSRIIESGMGEHNNKELSRIPITGREALGMETWESHQKRLGSIMKEVQGVWVMVSHAFPIRAALSLYLGLNELESYGINIRYASISVIDLEDSEVLCIGSRYLSERVKNLLSKK